TLLGQAVDRWGDDGRFVFVAGNIYQMPLATGVLDALTMVRVMHHLADVPGALAQLRRLLRPDGVAVLEYASKRHLKAIARWLLRQQDWSPFHQEPLEFVRLNFDFHPRWMDARLQEAGFRQEQRLAVSHFRLPALKRRVPHQTLVAWERPLLRLGGRFPLAPSVFVRVRPAEAASTSEAPSVPEADPEDAAALFRCPHCTTEPLQRKSEDRLTCPQCQRTYGRKGQIWDFKESLM
ncbi:MAG: methyltransferase domain-containing protein, partial [Caldilineae bacterium]